MMLFAMIMMAAAAHGRARPQLDACRLLTKADVASVQGQPFTDTKLSVRGASSTTCFYQLPAFTQSVSVDLMRTGGREFWEEHFEDEHRGEAGDPDEKVSPPLKVPGLGREAFWVGSTVAGSLYVRKGDSLLRVSVGGAGGDKEKIERSKRLALKALKRM